MIAHAPAKLNLCLRLGPRRGDGLHEICSLFQPITLADELSVSEAAADEVVCDGVEGENLAERALAALRERGWNHPPVRIEIDKRIPVAAGLGGGSADAAAVLRLAAGEANGLGELAASLGADVPSQLEPALALVSGAGEMVEPLPEPGEYAVVLVPDSAGLSTAAVYAEADRLGLGRPAQELAAASDLIREAARIGASPLEYRELLVNDLQPAALSLRPELRGALDALEAAGASHAALTGSGPTAFGLFPDLAAADRALAGLPARLAGALIASPERFR